MIILIPCAWKKAKHLLENTNTKVIDIALEVGFDTLPYFSSVFKKYTGVSPAEFRKKNRYLKNESFCTFCVRTFVFLRYDKSIKRNRKEERRNK